MNADSTLFDDNDLTEPDYSGQVVAWSYVGPHETWLNNETRRIFKRLGTNFEGRGVWKDNLMGTFYFSDLRDIVIINRGVKL